ncbi:MAG: carbohydrate binding domain-containing protein [Melioribacteraceae bacterium]|nr:carbohydrate binding domain-containing protein [Melioribacteraceae bacterium]
MKQNILFTLILIVVLSVGNLFAENYYIDATNGNDANNGLSPNAAWKTLTKLNNSWSIIKPGDNILFKRGEVWRPSGISNALIAPPNSGLHGTENARIIFGAYGEGAKPIISRKNSSSAKAFYARNISYVTIQDIEFRGDVWFYGSLTMPSRIHHIQLLRITLDGNAPNDATGGSIDFYAPAVEGAAEQWNQSEIHNIEVGYSLIKNTSHTGLQIYGQGNNWVHHNELYNLAQSGINFAEGDNNIIEYNIVSGAVGPGIKHSVHSHTANNIVIRGNLFLNTRKGGIAVYNLTNSKIYNNTIRVFGNESAIFGWTTQTPVPISNLGTTGFDNNLIQNNIFYGGPIYLWKAENVKITYKDGTTITYRQNELWDDNIFRSNIYYDPGTTNQMFLRDFVEGTTVYYNSSAAGTYSNTISVSDFYVKNSTFDSFWKTKTNVINDLNSDPLFVNGNWSSPENYGDYNLRSNSPGVNAGAALSYYSVDLAGNSVPTSGSIDIGAFQSNSADAVQPALLGAQLNDPNTLLLSFSEAVNSFNVSNTANYSISGGITVNSAQLSQNQMQILLKTSSHNYNQTYTVVVSNLTDLAGNVINQNADSFNYSISAPSDVIPPNLVDAQLSNPTTLRLSFSEGLEKMSAENVNNYQITDGTTNTNPNLFETGKGSYENDTEGWVPYSSNTISTSTLFASEGSRSLKITFVNSAGGAYLYLAERTDLVSDLTAGKQYTVSFSAMVDNGEAVFALSGGGMSAIDIPLTNNMTQYQITFTAQSANMHFLRCAGLGSGESVYVDKVEIRETSSARNSLGIISASISDDNKEVILTTTEHNINTTYTVSVNNVSDESGNEINASANSVSYILEQAADTTPPAVNNVYLSDSKTLKVKFSEPIQDIDALNVANYQITSNNTAAVNLFQEGKGTFESGTESWTAYGSNLIESTSESFVSGSKSLKITYVNSAGGAYLYLSNAKDLSSNLEVGKEYTLSFWAKVNQGDVKFILSGGRLRPIALDLTNSFQKYEIKFTALSQNRHYIRFAYLSRGESVYLDNISLTGSETISENIQILSAALNSLKDEVTLSTSEHSSTSSYSLKISNIKDLAGNSISPAESTFDYQLFQNINNGKPSILNTELADNSTLIIAFSEMISNEFLSNISNVFISDDITVERMELSHDLSQLVIYTSKHDMNRNYTVELSNISTLDNEFFETDSLIKSYSSETITDLNDNTIDIPSKYELYNNYPNPFNPSTVISFGLPENSLVNIKVYNILGEVVSEIINKELNAGKHQITFDASNLSSGIYLYTIKAGEFVQTKKMILTK